MRLRLAALILSGLLAASCRDKPHDAPPPKPSAAATSFTLRGEGFEIVLPPGFKAHPNQAAMENLGAIGGSYELIVATYPADLANAAANGISFDDVFRELAEVRRRGALDFAAAEADVDAPQPQEIEGMQAYVFKGRLAKAPFEGSTVFSALVALPGFKAGAGSVRTLVSFSLYDGKGSAPAELDRYGRGLLKGLKTIDKPPESSTP